MPELTVSLSSPPDREKLVADIFVGNEQMAEIHQENPQGLSLDIYPRRDGKPWQVSYEEFSKVLAHAKNRLVGGE